MPKGVPRPPETRAKISVAKLGEKHPLWRGDAVGYYAAHAWLRRHYDKTGICEKCGRTIKTEWSFLLHPKPHTRNRDDYRELCRSCHRKMDNAKKQPRLLCADPTHVIVKRSDGGYRCRTCQVIRNQERRKRNVNQGKNRNHP